MSLWSVHLRGRARWWRWQHRHWQRHGLQKWKWLVSSWERVHFPVLPLRPPTRTIHPGDLESDDSGVQTSRLLRPHSGSHTWNWSRCSWNSPIVSNAQEEAAMVHVLLELYNFHFGLNLKCFIKHRAFYISDILMHRLLSERPVMETSGWDPSCYHDSTDGVHCIWWRLLDVLVSYGGKWRRWA